MSMTATKSDQDRSVQHWFFESLDTKWKCSAEKTHLFYPPIKVVIFQLCVTDYKCSPEIARKTCRYSIYFIKTFIKTFTDFTEKGQKLCPFSDTWPIWSLPCPNTYTSIKCEVSLEKITFQWRTDHIWDWLRLWVLFLGTLCIDDWVVNPLC